MRLRRSPLTRPIARTHHKANHRVQPSPPRPPLPARWLTGERNGCKRCERAPRPAHRERGWGEGSSRGWGAVEIAGPAPCWMADFHPCVVSLRGMRREGQRWRSGLHHNQSSDLPHESSGGRGRNSSSLLPAPRKERARVHALAGLGMRNASAHTRSTSCRNPIATTLFPSRHRHEMMRAGHWGLKRSHGSKGVEPWITTRSTV
jgi:hypothetical protein